MPTENGWEPHHAPPELLEWRKIPGTNVTLRLMKGWPSTVMTAFAADYNAYVEPLRDADSGGFTPTNSVATSNHLNGTAMDLNWNGPDGKTFRLGISEAAAYPGEKSRNLRELMDFYTFDGLKIIFCGGVWSIRDWMHFQMNGNTWKNPKVLRFIEQRIRPDGFSTYKRDVTVPPLPPKPPPIVSPPAATILARAAGITQAKAEQILPQVSFALTKANCTNPRRIAAALAQWIIESGHFVYTEEIASGPESQERWKYKGRTWIQLTWLENYLGFSRWCHSLGLVPTPTYFGDHPKELAEQKWAALGPAYWWAIKYPKINEYADRGDIDNVSKWVNAPAWVDNPNKHANHEAERRAAYNKALALGDQLLALTGTTAPPPTQPGDDMALVPQEQWDNFYRAYMSDLPSISPLRALGEGAVGPLHRLLRNIDSSEHIQVVELLASLGHPDSLARLNSIANADPVQYPDRQKDRRLAQEILEKAGKPAPVKADVVVRAESVDNRELADAYAEIARLREENSRLRVEAARQMAVVSTELAVPAESAESTTGDRIGRLVDSVEDYTDLALSMDTKQRAALSASIKVLEMKNGTQS